MIVDTTHQRLFLNVRNPEIIRQALPELVEEVSWRGHNLAVLHTTDTTRVLRNLNINAPSPIRSAYSWPGKYKPFEHQIATAEFCTLHRKGFILNEMGTAKTASVLWAADYMMDEGAVNKVLIIAPMSTLDPVWRQEAFSVLMHRTAVVLYSKSAERRLELFRAPADFYIINYEGLPIIQSALKKRNDIDLVIVDEAAAYRNSQTARYKTLTQCLPENARLWLMTGTPCPNAPTDAWAIARLVNKARVPQYFTSWKRQTMQQVSVYKWKEAPGARELVFKALQPAVRFAKKDCLDLPPVTFTSRQVELTNEQQTAYKLMQQHLVTYAQSHRIDAVNAADKITKLRQILCGAIKNPDTGEYVTLPHGPRLNVLLECIEQANAKVVVVVPFTGILRALYEEVKAHYSCAVVNGEVSITARNKIWERFKHSPDPRVLLCHPQVMSHGLNLTEADTTVFYAPIYSNDQAQQVVERFNRPGQARNMTVVRLGAVGLEWEIYRLVEGRQATQQSILNLYKLATQDKL